MNNNIRPLLLGVLIGSSGLVGGQAVFADEPVPVALTITTEGVEQVATISYAVFSEGKQTQSWTEQSVCTDDALAQVFALCQGATDNRARPSAYLAVGAEHTVIDRQRDAEGKPARSVQRGVNDDARAAGLVE